LNAAQLTVSSRGTDKGALIEAAGEVDLTTVLQLREPVLKAVGNTAISAVIVDLSHVDFIDSAGLALLVEARKRLAPEGRTLYILLTRGRQPERVLRLGRFDTIINLIYDLDEISSAMERA
jgi:anti-sigma B factor antagonist